MEADPQSPPLWGNLGDAGRDESVSSSMSECVCPWDSPSKNTGVSCHFLLQGNLPNPGIELGLLHCLARSLSFPLSKMGLILPLYPDLGPSEHPAAWPQFLTSPR